MQTDAPTLTAAAARRAAADIAEARKARKTALHFGIIATVSALAWAIIIDTAFAWYRILAG
jgi:hypothetical protein